MSNDKERTSVEPQVESSNAVGGDEQLREAAKEMRRKIDVMARSNSWTCRGETIVSRQAYLDVIDADKKLRSALAGKEE